MVGRILKIPYKFQMANHKVKGEEDQGGNARIGAIHLGRVCKFIEQDSNIQDGLERRRTNFNSCDTSNRWGRHSLVASCKLFISLSIGMWAYFYVSMVVGL